MDMDSGAENKAPPQWMSVTGRPLDLGLDSGFQGK